MSGEMVRIVSAEGLELAVWPRWFFDANQAMLKRSAEMGPTWQELAAIHE